MSKIKKIFIFFCLLSLVSISIFTPVAYAQDSDWYDPGFGDWSTKVFDTTNPTEIFGERYTYAQVNWIVYSLLAVLTGKDVIRCANLISTGNTSEAKDCIDGISPLSGRISGPADALAFFNSSLLNNHPASGVDYVASTMSNLKIIPNAYAQEGAGFNAIQPVQAIWRASKTISYSLLVLVFIGVAFAIMFRIRISPQAVITIQSAIPKLILAVILITFSYAIAGFLIDLSYVLIGLFAVAIKSTGTEISTYANSIDLFNQLNSGNGLLSIVFGFLVIIALLAYFALFSGISALGGNPFGIALAVVAIILIVILITILFRLFWTLTKTTINLIFLVIMGPFMILLGALPNTGTIGSWIRNLLANAAVYPTVTIMLFLSHYFFWGWVGGANSVLYSLRGIFIGLNTYHINQDVVNSQVISLPGAAVQSNILGLVAAFGILFMVPSAAEIVKSFMQGKPFTGGFGLGPARQVAGLGAGAGIATIGTDVTRPGATAFGGRFAGSSSAQEFIKTLAGYAARGFR